MLDRPHPKRVTFETAFNDWWRSQPGSSRDRVSPLVARACFRAGYTAGKTATERRFVFRAGRMRITVWATGIMEAKKKAEGEADFRAAKNGWPIPKAGWQLQEVR
ncbi:hypothetical protein CO657_30410 (plasmid) [Rhizobium acidisoli]|uniref:Uncharacterized protein n=1 Tax=Rhizobium acidisoli TaxID=1538158 RepID=A0AAE5WU34_9HYPH|nr:hypothetical protein [Rhizobium acidisoli]KPH06217.1 hypothetical protein AOG23_23600 [Rhizobium acidisoli]QAS82518.1 hypothetical protein CO657_30410 [Rhizobium acidisoli]